MEERLHPTPPPHATNETTYVDPTIGSRQATSTTTVGENDHIYPAYQPQQLSPSSDDDDGNRQQLIVSPSQHQQHPPQATYIIQFPREQIYRVPPPSNAEIVERHRKPEPKKKKSRFSLPLIILILVVFGILCGVIAAVYNLTLNPKTPTFTVEKLTVKPLKQTHFSNKDPINAASVLYEVVLEAKNPNGVNGIRYEGGEVSLDYKGKVIGRSSSGFMAFDQDPKGIDEVEVTVDGAVAKGRGGGGGSLPKEVEESMKSSKVNKKTRLGLEMKVLMKMKTWLMTKRKELTFACDFEVSSLAPNKDTRILSQDCKAS